MDFKFFTTYILLLFLLVVAIAAQNQCEDKPKIVCYFASWSFYRPDKGQFKISDIEAKYCTHIIYTFAGLSIDGEIESLDPQLDIGYDRGFKQIVALKQKNPCLKVLISIGGWNEGSEKYSLMVETQEQRTHFAEQALRFVIHHGFDGLDFDWEYPTQRGGLPADKLNYIALLGEIKFRFSTRKKMLTVAVIGAIGIAEEAYKLSSLCNVVDQIHLMAYDLNDPTSTSAHAPLYPTINDTVNYYSDPRTGCDKSKIILGIPTYGKSYTLLDVNQTGLQAPIKGVGEAGPYTSAPGFLGFNEICELQTAGGWTEVLDKRSGLVYAWKGDQWVSYDNIESTEQKAQFALDKQLGGVLFWTIDTDDFRGTCYQFEFPLLENAWYVLHGETMKSRVMNM